MSKPVGTTAGVDYRLMAQSYEPEGEVIDEKRN
jgi:hypothetical protein